MLSGWLLVLLVTLAVLRTSFGNAHSDAEAKMMQHVNMTKLLELLNHPIDDVVDSSLESMMSVTQMGNLCPFKRKIFTKIQNGEPIDIHILGGSVTVGADLRNPKAERWSTHFEQIMNSGWYSNRINVHNQAIAACNVNIWVDMVSKFKGADLVIVDLSVNDQGFDLQVLPHYYTTLIQQLDSLPNHPALMFQQAFRSGQREQREVQVHCPNDYTTCCEGVLFCRRWWEMHDFVTIALKKYHVPYMSYRNLVWPEYEHPASNLNLFWNGLSHPDYKAHKLMAKLLSVGFMMQLKHAHKIDCEDTSKQQYVSSSQVDNTIRSACPSPLVTMMAKDVPTSISTFNVSAVGDYWRFYSDSKNKFGWILETNKTSMDTECGANGNWCENARSRHTLALKIIMSSETPTVQLRFLRSYSPEMGSVKVWLDDKYNEAVELNGKWDSPYSVMNLATLSTKKLEINSLMVGESHVTAMLTPGAHVLRITGANMPSDKFKWKLLGVTTC